MEVPSGDVTDDPIARGAGVPNRSAPDGAVTVAWEVFGGVLGAVRPADLVKQAIKSL